MDGAQVGQGGRLKYNAENRLVEIKKNTVVIASFTYDGDGQRVKSVIGSETILFIGGHYEIKNPGAGQQVTKYYFAGASRVAMRKYTIPVSMAVEYFLGDHLGSTSITTDTSGAKVSEMRYKAWGEVRYSWTSGVSTTPPYTLPDYTFTGQYSNVDDFGLMFYNARWYDPMLGRFTQADSLIPQQQGVQAWDRYAYTSNNPLRFADPSGHGICEFIQSLFGIALSCPSSPASGALINVGVNDEGGAYINVGIDPPANNGWIIDPPEWQDLDPCICDPMEVLEGEIEGFDPVPGDDTLGVIADTAEGGQNDNPISRLPERPNNTGKTSELLIAGGEETPLISGVNGPASQMPSGSSGFNIVTRTHVEGHAAALMGQNGWNEGTLIINNPPCASCNKLLPRMLPPNSSLRIIGPNGYDNVFRSWIRTEA